MTTGYVEDVSTHDGGNWFQYRFKIDGDTYGVFANEGQYDHIGAGDTVDFEWFQKGKYKNIKSIEVTKKATPKEKQEQQNKNDFTGERIFYSGVQKPAVELVVGMINNDIVSLPQKKADKMDAVVALVNTITERLANQVEDFANNKSLKDLEDVSDLKE